MGGQRQKIKPDFQAQEKARKSGLDLEGECVQGITGLR